MSKKTIKLVLQYIIKIFFPGTKSNKIIFDKYISNNALFPMETENFDEPTICNSTCKRKSAVC